MLSSAGRELGDRVLGRKREKKEFQGEIVVSVNAAKKFSWRTEKVTHGQGSGKVLMGFSRFCEANRSQQLMGMRTKVPSWR